jgi:putative mycofactocin binding protein MftB
VDEAAGSEAFDLDRAWALNASVRLRPERFGALAYDLRTRRLSILKDRGLVEILRHLEAHASAREACMVCGIDAGRLGTYARALGTLARSGMILERDSS